MVFPIKLQLQLQLQYEFDTLITDQFLLSTTLKQENKIVEETHVEAMASAFIYKIKK